MTTTRRRAITGMVAGAMALGLAACGADGDTRGDGDGGAGAGALEDRRVGAMEDFGVGDTFVATEPVDFSMLAIDLPQYPLQKDWLVIRSIEERNKVGLDITTAPLSDWSQRRSLLIGAGDAPDFIPFSYPGDEDQFVASGAILPVSDYLDLMPNFTDKVERWGLEEELDTLRQEDGKYYLLPGLLEQLRPDYTVAMRMDLVEDAGASEPETWDDFRDTLAAVKAANGGDFVFSDRWQGNALMNIAAPSFGTDAGWGYGAGVTWDDEAGEFVYTGASDRYRELVEYFHGLVEDGLMDPESFTQQDEQAFAKLGTGQSAAMSVNAQELVLNRATLATGLGGEDFDFRKIRVPAGPAGDIVGGNRMEGGIMISSSAAEDEDFVAMMQFIDWLYYSDEGLEFGRWGVEGETFTREADGTRVLDPDVDVLGLNPGATTQLQADYGFFTPVFSLAHGSSRELTMTLQSEEELAWQETMADKEGEPLVPPYPLSEVEREEASLYQTALSDHVQNNTLQFILGQRPLSEWDAYVAELEGMNMQAYLDVVNGARQRFEENNG